MLELIGLGGAAAAPPSPRSSGIDGRRGGADRDRGEDLRRPEQPVSLPILGFAGSPTVGVDVRKVVELQITPAINTGILPASDGLCGRGGHRPCPDRLLEEALLALDASVR